MTGRDDSKRPRSDLPPGGGGTSAGDDLLEQGGRQLPVLAWRPPRAAVILAAAALLAGFAVGYAAGDRHAGNGAVLRARSPAASPTALPAAGALALSQSAGQCSAQIGHALELGVQVTNQSSAEVILRRVQAVLPLGGLKVISQAWGPCGELVTGSDAAGNSLPAGSSAWFTVTFKVLVRCPVSLPVQFTVDYDWRNRPATTHLPGFADLGQVPYAGCPGD